MNIENFINEFKNYCETVENTMLLEIIKQCCFDEILNIQTIVDDYIEIDLLNASNEDIIKEVDKLSKVLNDLARFGKQINNIAVRDIYLLFSNFSEDYIESIFKYSLSSYCEKLYNKIYPNESGLLIRHELKDSDFDKDYMNLYNLLDKHNIC